jgi:hypothetical protein
MGIYLENIEGIRKDGQMGEIKKPKTMKEQIDQIWWIIIGYNGGGLVSKVDAINSRFDDYIETRAATCPLNVYEKAEEHKAAIKRDKKRTRVQTMALIVALMATACAILVAIFKA